MPISERGVLHAAQKGDDLHLRWPSLTRTSSPAGAQEYLTQASALGPRMIPRLLFPKSSKSTEKQSILTHIAAHLGNKIQPKDKGASDAFTGWTVVEGAKTPNPPGSFPRLLIACPSEECWLPFLRSRFFKDNSRRPSVRDAKNRATSFGHTLEAVGSCGHDSVRASYWPHPASGR